MNTVRSRFLSLFLTLVLAFGLAVPTGAASLPEPDAEPYASRYFRDYTVSINALGNGRVSIIGNVIATQSMSRLGGTKVLVYESGKSSPVGTYTTGWYKSNVISSSFSVTHQGTAGKSYYAVITFYAADQDGHETRSRTSSRVTAT